MTNSLVYLLKRRRLVTVMLLVLGLLAVAMVMVPSWQPAGPVFAERCGPGVAMLLVEPGDQYRIEWRADKNLWSETEAFQGRVTATMGGQKLVVFHGLSYTTYAAGADGAPENERWDKFEPGWSVVAAAGNPLGPDWAFGKLDDYTIVAARRDGGKWTQVGELKRPGAVRELTAAAGPSGAWLWWREGNGVMSAPLVDTAWRPRPPVGAVAPVVPSAAWGAVRPVAVDPDARIDAASGPNGPALYVATRLKKTPILVTEILPGGARREFNLTKDWPFVAPLDEVSAADGNPPAFAAVGGVIAQFAFLDIDQSLVDLLQTLFRYRPGAGLWFLWMMFASFSIVGIGVSLLFERRKVTQEALLDQARMLSGVAPLSSRMFAASIDTVPFLWGFELFGPEAGLVVSWIAATVICCVYHTAAEAVWGQSLGKRLAGIVVKRTDGTPATLPQILIRNSIRALEMTPPFLMLPAVLMISTKRMQRLGDLLSGTMVARVEKEAEAEEKEA